MNKFGLSFHAMEITKNMFQKDLKKKFSTLDEDSFFSYVNKGIVIDESYFYNDDVIVNKNLLFSKKVLLYCLNNNFSLKTIIMFDNVLFDDEVLKTIKEKDYNIRDEYYRLKPILLNNEYLIKDAINNYPYLISYVDSKYINDDIIKILIKSKKEIVIDEDLLKKVPSLRDNNTVMIRAIESVPRLIILANKLDNDLVDYAIKCGYIPTMRDFDENIYLTDYPQVIDIVFESNPHAIVYMKEPQLNYNTAMSAVQRGYIVTIEDLKLNPSLGAYYSIIRPAIKNNPELLKYIKDGCYLLDSEIENALKHITITVEDLRNNPELCNNAPLMNILGDEYRLYSKFLSEEDKIKEVLNAINNNISLTTLPFLDMTFGSKASASKLDKVLKLLDLKISHSNLDLQSRYYQDFDMIVDGVVGIRYDLSKKNSTYSDIVAINDDILNCFKSLQGNDTDDKVINELIDKIYLFTGKAMDRYDIVDSIYDYYDIYTSSGKLTLIDTSYFCNVILNFNRNYYMSNEKQKILKEVKTSFEISDKRKKQLINSKKIKVIVDLIKQERYDLLGVTKSEFNDIVNECEKLKNNKNIKKSGVEITDEMLKELKKLYKKSVLLNHDEVRDIINSGNMVVITQVINTFSRINAKFFNSINNINLTDKEIQQAKEDGVLGTEDYIIGNEDTYKLNIAKLILNLTEDEAESILSNEDKITSIKYIIPFANIIKEYDTDILAKILSNYSKIVDKITMMYTGDKSNLDMFDLIIKKMNIVITLAKGYASVDDTMLFSLGEKIVPRLGETSCKYYFDFYKSMLRKMEGTIPPVEFKYDNNYYKSGDYANAERLLIGKLYDISCIDLNNPGEATYKECLAEANGDVVLIKDKSGEIISRMLLIRRGNVVQIIMKAMNVLPVEVYKTIGKKMIEASIANGDNLDYVVVASSVVIDDNNECRKVTDQRFVTSFPHADLEETVSIVGCKKNTVALNINFDVRPTIKYVKLRKKINYDTNEIDVTRLRALRIALELDEMKKQDLARNVNVYDSNEYVRAISGEDWYIAIRKDGTLEELILPNGDSRSFDEIDKIKSLIAEEEVIKGKQK